MCFGNARQTNLVVAKYNASRTLEGLLGDLNFLLPGSFTPFSEFPEDIAASQDGSVLLVLSACL